MSGSSKLQERDDAEVRVADEAVRGKGDDAFERDPTLFDRKRMLQTVAIVLVLVGAIYFLLPKVVGLDDAIGKLDEGDPLWIAIAFAFSLGIPIAYIALFRGVVGESIIHLEWKEAYEISMASFAASRLFAGGGAGGIVLTYWALRKAGMEPRQTARRMVAFLVLLYTVYLVCLVVFGVLLRTGVLPGAAPPGLTIVPAAIAGVLIAVIGLLALIPADMERRFVGWSEGHRFSVIAGHLVTVPDTLAHGTRTALEFIRQPRKGALALIGSIGFWAANIGALWASFKAFDVHVAFGVVVQGYFVGMVANLIPGAPGGVGTVDAGMIGAFVLFGLPGAAVFAAVLVYRLFAFWLPVIPGFIAFLQLRRTVARWEESEHRPLEAAPAAAGAG
jgi:uncharacterized protein (TIRG00374 family)